MYGANLLISISCKTMNIWLYQARNVKHFLNRIPLTQLEIIKTDLKGNLRFEVRY